MSTIKDFLCLLLVVICYGIAGRMDHDDAILFDEAQRHPAFAASPDCPAAVQAAPQQRGFAPIDLDGPSTDADPCVVE